MTERSADQARTATRPDPGTDTQPVPLAGSDQTAQRNGRPPLAERLQRRITAAADERRASAAASPPARVLPPPPADLTPSAPVPEATPAPTPAPVATPAPSARTTARTRRTAAKIAARGPRRARLRLSRIDPWSVMKVSFLLSIAFGIVTVVSVFMVWSVLGAAGVWSSINSTVADMVSSGNSTSTFNVQDYLGTSRVLGFTMLVSVIDVILITAIATLGAFLYNMASSLLGGIEVTLSEDPH
jgi:hypothetical protein